MKQNKFVTALVVTATILLAGVAIFTAVRLYQSRYTAIAPTAPSETGATYNPSPTPGACQALTFTLTQGTPTGTPTGTVTQTPTKTPTPTVTATGTPSVTPTSSVTTTVTTTNSPTPTTTSTTSTNTPTNAPTQIAQASPTGSTLPDAGVGIPTMFAVMLGILVLGLSIVLVL
jgi:hypothetical protein